MRQVPSILIVHENDQLCTDMRSALEHENYQVAAAKNGVDAVAKLRTFTFDLVVLNGCEPDSASLDLVREILGSSNATKLVVIAEPNAGNAEVLHLAKRLGTNRVVYKPFAMAELIDVIGDELALE